MVTEKGEETRAPVLSDNWTVNVKVPPTWGVPCSAPEFASSVSPPVLPERIDHTYGLIPPEAESVCRYGVPMIPLNRGGTVVIVSAAGLSVIVKVWVEICRLPSVTWTAKL